MEKEFSKFDQMIQGLFDPKSSFDYRLVETWSSMQSLIVVSAIDEHYDMLVGHEDLKRLKSVEELHTFLLKKSA